MSKKISIVLPTYNGEKIIKKSIDSILNQTYGDFELIIVNDCSTDNTLNIIKEYENKDNRIKIINNVINKKLPLSLNVGFENATGEYLTWTSDDNMYHKNALEVLVNFLDNNENIDLVYANYNLIDIDGRVIEEKIKHKPDEIKFYNPIGACFMYRKEIAHKIGVYDKDLFLAEDYEYWIRIYLNGKIFHIDENLYDYAIHENSLNKKKKDKIEMQTYLAKDKHFNELYARCYTREDKIRFLSEMLNHINDKNFYIKKRNEYYKLNYDFKIYDKNIRKEDLKIRIKNKIKNFIKRIIK